jgi:stage II sporulation protein P
MPRLTKKGRRALIKFLTGFSAVLISPPLSSFIGQNSDMLTSHLQAAWHDEVAAVEMRHNAVISSLEMNNSALLLYKPPEIGQQVIPQTLPALPEYNYNFHDNSDIYYPFPQEFITEHSAAAEVLSQNISDTREENVRFAEVDGRIVKTTFEPGRGHTFVNLDLAGQVRNDTGYSNEFVLNQSRILPNIELSLNGEPEILIIHTHTTEAFQPERYDFFDSNYNSRSLDSRKNIVAVGEEMARSFAEAGITVIHDGTIHDYPQFSGSYSRSAETVRRILQAYPSIKVVLDVHRDAIDDGNGSRIAPVTSINGRDAAQVMIISAADDGTYNMPHYLENFRLASLLQQYMEFNNPGITRPVWFQYSQYNQHLSTGSLLIEVGSHGNTLSEAKYTGRLIGTSMAEALLALN